MRITENFTDAVSDDVIQVSVKLETHSLDSRAYVEFHTSAMTPRFRISEIDTLIGMLEALKRRAGKP